MKIGIADTMFSRVDMFEIAKKAIDEAKADIRIERYTVPGVKDLPVASKRLFEEYDCEIVVALGMPGAAPIDKTCAHEASLGLGQVQILLNKHILEVFVHMDEAKNDDDLYDLAYHRTYDHAKNALALLQGKTALSAFAGKGIRQGRKNEGPAIRR